MKFALTRPLPSPTRFYVHQRRDPKGRPIPVYTVMRSDLCADGSMMVGQVWRQGKPYEVGELVEAERFAERCRLIG